MSKLASVEPLNGDAKAKQYDAFLASVGYESRATHVFLRRAPLASWRIACAFTDRHVGAFEKNHNLYRNADFQIDDVPESDVAGWTQRWFEELGERTLGQPSISLAIDISSMSRVRLASVVAAIMSANTPQKVEVDFFYAIAKWSSPSDEPEPIVKAGAVLPFFAGWSIRPDLPVVALIGLGYEPDKAMGAYEYLEASDVWVFVPRSNEVAYSADVDDSNKTLLPKVPLGQKIVYRVDQPARCFGLLEAIVCGSLTNARPVLLPFGPKIFALAAMLVACLHRDVPVWRISSGQQGDPVEREASGQIVGLRAGFIPAGSCD